MHHILYGAFDTFFRPCGAKRSGIERVVRLHPLPPSPQTKHCCVMLTFMVRVHRKDMFLPLGGAV